MRKTTHYRLLFVVILLSILSCSDKKKGMHDQKELDTQLTKADSIKYKKLPDQLKRDFVAAFQKDFYKILGDSMFVISKSNYADIMKKAPIDADTVTFQLMYIKGNIPKEYAELNPFKNRIYAVYYYKNSSSDTNFYAPIGVKSTLIVDKNFVDEMTGYYNNIRKKELDQFAENASKENTKSIKMSYSFFKGYDSLCTKYPNFSEVHLSFGKITNTKIFIESQSGGLFNKKNYVSALLNLQNNVGQLMFITNGYSGAGGITSTAIEPALSGYDMNHFCPEDCP